MYTCSNNALLNAPMPTCGGGGGKSESSGGGGEAERQTERKRDKIDWEGEGGMGQPEASSYCLLASACCVGLKAISAKKKGGDDGTGKVADVRCTHMTILPQIIANDIAW